MSENTLYLINVVVLTAILGAITWRLTYMFTEETGPYKIFQRIRDLVLEPEWFGSPVINGKTRPPDTLRPKNIVGEILSCFYCASVWFGFMVSLPSVLYLGLSWKTPLDIVFLTLAASGIAILSEEGRRSNQTGE